jgi:hypothetical protein
MNTHKQGLSNTHPMQNAVSVAELQSPKRHRKPALDISRKENDGAVLDGELEVCVQEFKDQVQVRLRRKHIKQLTSSRLLHVINKQFEVTHHNHILVLQLPQIFDLANRRHIQPVFELANLDFLDSYFAATVCVMT